MNVEMVRAISTLLKRSSTILPVTAGVPPSSTGLGAVNHSLEHPRSFSTGQTTNEPAKHKRWVAKLERQALKQRQQYSKLLLPSYSSLTDVKYAHFVRDLNGANDRQDESLSKVAVDGALRQCFMNVYGQTCTKTFFQTHDRRAEDPRIAAGSSLRDEGEGYWKHR